MKRFLALSAAGVALSAGFLAAPASAFAASKPASVDVVLDTADLFTDAQEKQMSADIEQDFNKYDLVFVVKTIPSLGGRNIDDYSRDEANRLGVGDATKDNGVLIVIARDDHKIRIELGSGVDDRVSDEKATQIIADDMTPQFREDRFFEGTVAAMDSVGKAYTSDTASSDSEDSEGFVMPSWVKTLLLILAGVGSLIILTVASIFGISVYNTKKIEHFKKEREDLIIKTVQQIMSDAECNRELLDAPNESARTKLLAPYFEKFQESKLGKTVPTRTLANLVAGRFAQIKQDQMLRKESVRVYTRSVNDKTSIQRLLDILAENIVETKKREAEARKQAELRRIEAEKVRKQQKKEAADFWSTLSKEQKAEVKKARTKKDKIKALSAYTSSSSSADMFFPFILASFASEIGQPASSSSSSVSSSSKSSSYTSSSSTTSSFDTSSFGGGSFDGGGGGGGW